MREFGKTVEGAEEDAMCVICQATPVNPIKVRLLFSTVVIRSHFDFNCMV